ncbi:MAG: NAD(P)H-dependent FMN reductase [Saprospiraceae bacterium]|jgi:NAD(P)H-dependent FMN reductase
MTLKVAKATKILLQKMTDEKVLLLDLVKVDFEKLNAPAYESTSTYANEIRSKYFIPTQKILFITPEYNGSFAGILKYFMDVISTVDFEKTFPQKKAAIIGVAQGRAGNLRGLTHLTSILMHMGMWVMPKNLPISIINNQFESEKEFNAPTQKSVEDLLAYFIKIAS